MWSPETPRTSNYEQKCDRALVQSLPHTAKTRGPTRSPGPALRVRVVERKMGGNGRVLRQRAQRVALVRLYASSRPRPPETPLGMCSNDARTNDAKTLRQDIPANFGPHVIDRRTK